MIPKGGGDGPMLPDDLTEYWPEPDDGYPDDRGDLRRFKGGLGEPRTSEEEYGCPKHNYEFKYMKEKVTEEGKIITQDHYFCKHCLEKKVQEHKD